MIAGIVTPTPNAIDSPALPAVCITLDSRMVASRIPIFERSLNNVIAITATGIEAETVSPVLSTRYSDDAPKIIPSNVPTISGNGVSSRSVDASGIYGLKFSRNGFFIPGCLLEIELYNAAKIRLFWEEGWNLG